jgi:membrane protease YdiL (CAAX protease family)
MISFLIPMLAMAIIFVVIVYLNEAKGLFAGADHFSSPALKWAAYAWLGAFMLFLTFLVTASSLQPTTAHDLERVPFYSLFALHAILVIFLGGWWLLSGRPSIGSFLNIPRRGNGMAVLMGLAVGLGGWIVTLAVALAIAGILSALGLMPKNMQPSPMIGWMAALPLWKKMLIVASAMTVEEAFFRAWLQKRIGLIASTILFALAHSGFGQPLLLVGVTVISLIIGTAFYRTKSLVPGIVAHGVFDAVQLFVVIPMAFQLAPK